MLLILAFAYQKEFFWNFRWPKQGHVITTLVNFSENTLHFIFIRTCKYLNSTRKIEKNNVPAAEAVRTICFAFISVSF